MHYYLPKLVHVIYLSNYLVNDKKKVNSDMFTQYLKYQSFNQPGGGSWWCNGKSDELRNRSKRVRIPVALLRSLSGKYPWERYEPPDPPSYGLNSTTTVLGE